LAGLVAKVRREERYHVMHVSTWFERLAEADGEPRERLLESLARMGPDAGSVLAQLPGEAALVKRGVISEPLQVLEARWREQLQPTFERLGLPELPPLADPANARSNHSEAFRWLHGEFTSVRRTDAEATW
jgi:ring-1,2-phenylacetyl-CoA epoxidase subunit PaaC